MNITTERAKSITNLVVGVLLLANMVLPIFGLCPLPGVDESSLYQVVSVVLASIFALRQWWWKNNNITEAAVKGQQITNDEKERGRIWIRR